MRNVWRIPPRMAVFFSNENFSDDKDDDGCLDSSDLIDIVSHQLGVVEFHVPVYGHVAKELVVVVVFVIASLQHGQMFPLPGFILALVSLLYGKL